MNYRWQMHSKHSGDAVKTDANHLSSNLEIALAYLKTLQAEFQETTQFDSMVSPGGSLFPDC
jgi:hypothetical protein